MALHNRQDRWCSLLSAEELQTLELVSDIMAATTKGYVEPINYQMACPLLDFAMRKLNNVTHHDKYVATLFFAHAETVIPLVAILGLFKDAQPLVPPQNETTWQQQMQNRQWRTSQISPFAANVMFVVTQCDGDALQVQVLVNERPIPIPKCNHALSCPLQKMMQLYASATGQYCTFHDMCMEKQLLSENK